MAAEKFLLGTTGGEGRWLGGPTTLQLSSLFVKVAYLLVVFSLLLRFDRHNIVVLSTGDAAINFERSFSDEPAWYMMMQEVWNDMTGAESNGGQRNGGAQTLSHENIAAAAQSYLPVVETFANVSPAKELCWEVCI